MSDLLALEKQDAGTEQNLRRISLDEIEEMQERGELLPTRKDAPEGPDLGADFWANAVLVEPKGRKSIHLRVESDVFDFFVKDTGGKGHIAKMQAVLKAYADAHR